VWRAYRWLFGLWVLSAAAFLWALVSLVVFGWESLWVWSGIVLCLLLQQIHDPLFTRFAARIDASEQ